MRLLVGSVTVKRMDWLYIDMPSLGEWPSLSGWKYLEWTECVECTWWSVWSCSDSLEQAWRMVTLELCSCHKRWSCCSPKTWKYEWGKIFFINHYNIFIFIIQQDVLQLRHNNFIFYYNYSYSHMLIGLELWWMRV